MKIFPQAALCILVFSILSCSPVPRQIYEGDARGKEKVGTLVLDTGPVLKPVVRVNGKPIVGSLYHFTILPGEAQISVQYHVPIDSGGRYRAGRCAIEFPVKEGAQYQASIAMPVQGKEAKEAQTTLTVTQITSTFGVASHEHVKHVFCNDLGLLR